RDSALGRVIGRAFRADEIPDAIERLLAVYLEYREVEEPFVDCVQRLGLAPFKEGVYAESATVEVGA
ncbi:MAG: nitrite/sulfite reductase, partial [Marinobacterium sp.]